ncbi:MAG TPA: hypothetical protein VMJ32_12405 [Pirellulales bacterium]|nr:hypothetical protein [Pirellulales bacterium]
MLIADNIGPGILLVALFIAPLVLAVACRIVTIALRGMRGQKPWWGLALAVLAMLAGAAELIMFLTMRGGAPTFFYFIAALPILAGLNCLVVWNKPPRT